MTSIDDFERRSGFTDDPSGSIRVDSAALMQNVVNLEGRLGAIEADRSADQRRTSELQTLSDVVTQSGMARLANEWGMVAVFLTVIGLGFACFTYIQDYALRNTNRVIDAYAEDVDKRFADVVSDASGLKADLAEFKSEVGLEFRSVSASLDRIEQALGTNSE